METLLMLLGLMFAAVMLPVGGYWLGRLLGKYVDVVLFALGMVMFFPTAVHLAGLFKDLLRYGDPNGWHRYAGPYWCHPFWWMVLAMLMFGMAMSRSARVKTVYVRSESHCRGW